MSRGLTRRLVLNGPPVLGAVLAVVGIATAVAQRRLDYGLMQGTVLLWIAHVIYLNWELECKRGAQDRAPDFEATEGSANIRVWLRR